MANPTVDKLKVFGLRHGEKIAMGVVAAIFATCSYFAFTHESINTTPDEVKKAATQAQANISNSPKKDVIVETLEKDGVKLIGFEKKVEALQAGTVDASQYALANTFVKPEPGAGLIRDMPELIAPTQIYVHAGRGAVRVIALGDDGKPKPKSEEPEKAPVRRKKPRANRGMGGGMMGGGMMGGMARKSKKKNTGALAKAQQKKDEERAEMIKGKGIAGAEEARAELAAAKKDDEELTNIDPTKFEDELNGYRFVTLVGKLDHKSLKEKYSKALKVDFAAANPNYLRLDVERQELQSDGSWSDWELIDRDPENVRKLLTKVEDEIVPPESLISTLVDQLPFLEVGYWVNAHHGALVPADALKVKEKEDPKAKGTAKGGKPGTGGMPGMGGGNMMGADDYAKMGAGSMAPGGGDYGAAMKNRMAGGMAGMPKMGGEGMGGAAAKGPSEGDFQKTSADWLMVRALDFSVDPDTTYRYRVRIVVANPNLGWESVSPGVDTKSKELFGPWSNVTAETNVPADVATYAIGKSPRTPADNRPDQIEFQVVRWDEEDGLTVVHKFDQAPGQIIGTKYSTRVPNDKKDKIVSREYDYTSHQVLADALGGDRPASEIQGLGVPKFEAPVLALVVRPDGMLMVRDQAVDTTNGERDEMKDIYDQIMKEVQTGKKKSSSSLMGGYGGAMGGMGGGMMGGYGGAMGGGMMGGRGMGAGAR